MITKKLIHSNFYMKINLLLACFILAGYYTTAQQTEFGELFDKLDNTIVTVKTSKYTYDQHLLFVENSVIKYGYTKTSVKGSAKSFEYELNIADIDPYVVREFTIKDLIVVNIKIRNSQKLIKVYEENMVKTYTDEMSMVALNIDNAREIRAILEKAIPHAEKIVKNKLSLENYDEMINWLTENVSDANTNDKLYRQLLKKDDQYPGKIYLITTINTGKSSTQNDYEFNLADINDNSLNFKVSGNQFAIEFETVRKNNLIKYTKDGVVKPFTNDIIIQTNNVEEARDLKNVLNMAIPLAKKEVEASFPPMNTEKESLDVSKSYMKDVVYGTNTYEQSLAGNCLAKYKRMEISESKNVEIEYSFNMLDINDNVLDFDVSSNKMYVDVTINNKQKLIRVKKNGELENYIEKLKIYCEDVEIARRLKMGLKNLIQKCRTNYQTQVPLTNVTDKINWLSENVIEVRSLTKTFNQTIEQIETEKGEITFKFTRHEIDEKGSDEHIYEFNISDLNKKSIDFKIKGKDVLISVTTNFKAKIVKYYKNGEIQNYKEAFFIYASDIEAARNIITALNEIIKEQS